MGQKIIMTVGTCDRINNLSIVNNKTFLEERMWRLKVIVLWMEMRIPFNTLLIKIVQQASEGS